MVELLTSSHDRGWKPTVKPWNTCGPGLSHEIASSIKALRDIKGGNGFYIFKGHTSTANIVNQEQ
jgi:hypothetical protein